MRAKGVAASAQHADDDRARRFHEAALPHLDDLYTLARYLMRNPDDAEDAVQERYSAVCGISTAIAVRP
ncbi:MAG TPA: hypothetical protein VGZ89_16385 [Xanthobacteraceae bacterium]|nr:hypothetical protein [Xanthobacteraceae bacterium]